MPQNQKARDEYSHFEQERKSLVDRGVEMARDAEKIRDFLKRLDAQKEESVGKTYQLVNKHFAQVFQEFVPGGKAKLVLLKQPEGAAPEGGDRFRGVNIKVDFRRNGSEGPENFENMEALSGGQKTIVSLALMLAIQRTDPPPFYLMDEVDAALDVQYRRRVVRLLAKLGTQVTHLSASSRTFCTTPVPKVTSAHEFA